MSVLAIIFPPPISIPLVLGVESVIVGVVLFLLASRTRRRFPRSVAAVSLLRTFAVIGGVTLMISAFVSDVTPDTNLPNPIPDTVRSVTAGADLFQANCAACHGADARGGGPAAATTQLPPADLRSGHLNVHTDGDIYYWISTGLPGGMPAWAAKLSDDDRWNLVNYLRSLNGTGPTASPASGSGTLPAATPASAQPSPGLLLPPLLALGSVTWLLGGLRRRRGRPRDREVTRRVGSP